MGIIAFIILGLIAGAIAKALWKGDEPGGVFGTLLVGVVGALLGGLVASAAGLGGLGSFFSIGTWLIAIGGALVLLFMYDLVVRRSDRGDTVTG
ncbi:MAG: GlsB/YeaQ/YmgE family stress response membrane protein [Thermoleophilaceae bacterium]|nr:GlsB/YeaQ/YmgE family stress response membrane protein [Thermoleophilaceae bacterium]